MKLSYVQAGFFLISYQYILWIFRVFCCYFKPFQKPFQKLFQKLFLQFLSMLGFRLAGKFNTQLTELQDIHLRQKYGSMNLAAF